MVKQWLTLLSFILITLACTPQSISPSIPTPASTPRMTVKVSEPTATPIPKATPVTPASISTSGISPAPSPTSGISRELSDAVSVCFWNVAHTEELPTLPADWLENPETMTHLREAAISTPEELHTTAKFDVLGYDSLQEYKDSAYENMDTFKEVVESQGTDYVLFTLTHHYLFCNERWQGREATEVVGQDDAIAAVAECAWRIAYSEGLPDVPQGIDDMTPSEIKAEAQRVAGIAVSASFVDAGFRARVDAGLDERILTETAHRVFCGGDWTGGK